MAKIITLGEIMLRLSPEDEPRTVDSKARLGTVSQTAHNGVSDYVKQTRNKHHIKKCVTFVTMLRFVRSYIQYVLNEKKVRYPHGLRTPNDMSTLKIIQ